MKRFAAAIALSLAAVCAWALTTSDIDDYMRGDVNGNGVVDITDVNIMLNIILDKDDAARYDGRADANCDDSVDINDLNTLLNDILTQPQCLEYTDIETYRHMGLMLLEINTVDGEMPTCDMVDHPEGAFGHSITNATKVRGRLVMSMMGDTIYDSGDYEDGVRGMTIKINGNTSVRNTSKPYKIKLQKKADLLMRGDSAYCDKEWRLIRDDMALNTMLGLKVNELMGMPWTPRFLWCNVFINGTNQGTYLLIETIKRNTKCRIDVDKTGFIIERDAYWWNEDVYFKSTYFNDNRYGWTFKYPDSDDVTQEQIDYIQQCINQAEQAISDGTYPAFIDVDSHAAWLLAHDILGTWDSGGSNLYLTKHDNTPQSKLAMGCLWDFDSNMGMGINSWSRYHTAPDFYFAMLFSNSNDAFARSYRAKWDQVKKSLPQELTLYLKEFASSPTAYAIDLSRIYRANYYKTYRRTVEQNVNTINEYMEAHLKWLDQRMAGN
ncbi:MAG: CotH kinase family protein [Muribaculaceae bacterium]|nr:CotH kinase family protein [Muribaculaceae bacterium]